VFEADNTAVTDETVRRAAAAAADRPSIYGADALAWTLHRFGDSLAAVPQVEQALRTGTSDAQVLFHAASIFDAVGEQERATDLLQQSAESNPWFSLGRQAEAVELGARLGVDWPTGPPT